jgi:hypothetical protein
MMKSTFHAILLSAAVSAIDAEASAESQTTYGMPLAGSLQAPLAAQTIQFPTDLTVGGGSVLPVVPSFNAIVPQLL